MSGNTGSLAERVAKVPPGTLQRLHQIREQHPEWNQGTGFLGAPDRTQYFSIVMNDRALERLHFTLARS